MFPKKSSLRPLALAITCVLGSGLNAAWATDLAVTPSTHTEAGWQHLLEQQAQRIAQLEARLAALETQAVTAAQITGVQPPAQTGEAASTWETRLSKIEAEQARQPRVSWSKGAPEFSSADGQARFKPRGRFFADTSSTGGSQHAQRNLSGTEIRSVRLGVEGRYGTMGYVVEGDFAENKVTWKSAYAALDHRLFGLPAEFSIGNRLNERGMDGTSSTAYTPFPGRNVVGTALMPQRGSFGLGLMQKIYGENWHAAVQISGHSLDNPGNTNDGLTYAVRAHWNPVRNDRTTVHLGAWAFHEQLRGSARALRGAPIAGPFNDQVRIGAGRADGAEQANGMGLELGVFSGPLWAYGEWGQRTLRIQNVQGQRDDPRHSAYAVSMGWFLHGAKPGYSAKAGNWTRVKVANPVTAGGAGAWEIKARYENADYTQMLAGGQGNAWTVGTNWYLNDASRVVLDVVRWQTQNRSGAYAGNDRGYTVNLRFQLAF